MMSGGSSTLKRQLTQAQQLNLDHQMQIQRSVCCPAYLPAQLSVCLSVCLPCLSLRPLRNLSTHVSVMRHVSAGNLNCVQSYIATIVSYIVSQSYTLWKLLQSKPVHPLALW